MIIDEAENRVTEAYYGNGKLDGLSETWYDNGQLREREIYKDGVEQ